jgi:NhaP-type Na+/H+ and K+/H+ antiporter
MDMELDDTDYETLGGFVYAQLDKIPNTGDAVTFEHVIFTVLAKRGRRIMKIRVQRHRPEQEKETDTKPHLLVLPSLEEREQRVHQVNRELPQTDEEASRYKV